MGTLITNNHSYFDPSLVFISIHLSGTGVCYIWRLYFSFLSLVGNGERMPPSMHFIKCFRITDCIYNYTRGVGLMPLQRAVAFARAKSPQS